MRLSFLAVALLLTCPAHAQFTGQRVTLDRRYPTDTKVPSKYGTQVVAKEGSRFLAGPCGVRVTADQIEVTLSPLSNKYTFADTTYNGYRLSIVSAHATAAHASRLTPHASISSVTVDPHTNLPGFDSARISWSGSFVQVNLASLTFNVSSRLVLDVTFAPSPRSRRTR